jgi:hypothetical protein
MKQPKVERAQCLSEKQHAKLVMSSIKVEMTVKKSSNAIPIASLRRQVIEMNFWWMMCAEIRNSEVLAIQMMSLMHSMNSLHLNQNNHVSQ